MIAVPSYFNTVGDLRFVQFASGPMSKATDDALIARQPSCPHYIGSTEIVLLPLLELHDPVQDWQYFHFHPWSGVEMRPAGGESELVVTCLPFAFP
jgi:hypothetical protein